jgi:hypothetical protein
MSATSLISENHEAIIKAVSSAANRQVDVQTEGTALKKVGPVVASMVLTAVNITVDAAKNGGTPTGANVGIFLVKRATGFAGLSESDKVLCVAALAELATSVATDGAVLAASSTAEVGTGGAATPVSVPLMIAAGASLALAGFKAHQQCGPLVTRAISQLNDEAFKVYLQANQFIGVLGQLILRVALGFVCF